MRFDQQKSACSRFVFGGDAGVGSVRFRQWGVRFRTGPGRAGPAPPVAAAGARERPATPSRRRSGPAAGDELVEDFVRRGGEDGAREQPGRSAPNSWRRRFRPTPSRRPAPPSARASSRDHQPQQHDAAGQFPHRHRRDADERQPPDQRRRAAAGPVGRWPLQRHVGRLEADNERCVEPVQPAARLGLTAGSRSRCCATSAIDSNRQTLLLTQIRQQVADIELARR